MKFCYKIFIPKSKILISHMEFLNWKRKLIFNWPFHIPLIFAIIITFFILNISGTTWTESNRPPNREPLCQYKWPCGSCNGVIKSIKEGRWTGGPPYCMSTALKFKLQTQKSDSAPRAVQVDRWHHQKKSSLNFFSL